MNIADMKVVETWLGKCIMNAGKTLGQYEGNVRSSRGAAIA